MASPLDKVAAKIAAGTRGKLRSGTLYRRGVSAGVDALGDALAGAWTSHDFEGVRSGYDEAYRKTAGIPETDSKILIIAGSTDVEPQKDDVAFIEGAWWQIRKVKADPVNASFGCQSFEIPKPEGIA